MSQIQGLGYPLQLDGRGGLLVTFDEDYIKGLIFSFFETYPLENPMRPKYGFNPELFKTKAQLSNINLKQRLEEFIPNTEFQLTNQINDNGEENLVVFWSYNNQPTQRLVLPGWN